MDSRIIVAQFDDEAAAARAEAELRQAGVAAFERTPAAGGLVRLAVQAASDGEAGRIRAILDRYRPVGAAPENPEEREVTLSGAPADHAISPGGLPHAKPGESLVRKEGRLAAEVDPESEQNRKD